MEKRKIGYIVLACIIIIGIIVIAFAGFNVSLEYSPSKQVSVYIGKEFESNEIKNIVKEVIGNKKVIVQKVELYEEIASITVEDITDEQIQQLNNKINEKYSLENTVKDDIKVTQNSNLRIRDIAKPFIMPVAISLAIILIYAGVRFRKINILEVLGKIIGMNVLGVALFVSIMAIVRIPVNALTVPSTLAIYVIITLVVFNQLEEKTQRSMQETKKK
ncbi:MAG: hypothetical protein HFJ41_00115 [Clostridia bacterium]|nr:hypothetical protein [Clostridia bacterium]